jgi:ABC-type transport system involved in multi-copper enzyme maturation permease subunit
MSYSSQVEAEGNGLSNVVHSEWTKLRTLRSSILCVALVVGLTVLMAVLGALGSHSFGGSKPTPVFAAQFAHQELHGNGEMVAHLVSQEDTGPDAKAGLMISQYDASSASPAPTFAAIMVTPGHGVQWLDGFSRPVQGSDASTPHWLKLRRVGNEVQGFESSDGQTWHLVGRAALSNQRSSNAIGMFSTSPSTSEHCVRESAASTACGPAFDPSTAVFDSVSLTDGHGRPVGGTWQSGDTTGPDSKFLPSDAAGSFAEGAGQYRVTGAGNLGLNPAPTGDNDLVRDSLNGIVIGYIALAVCSALFMTGEFRRGIVRTTFTASPRRSRVLTAKVIVIGLVSFVAGIVAAALSVLLGLPILERNGYGPPGYPDLSLTDAPVARAVIGTGILLALLAVFALALGAVVRRTAWAISLVVVLVILPFVIGPFLSLNGEAWLRRLTPTAGFAIQQTRPRFDDYIGPWLGTGVLAAYVAVALGLAYWSLNRRDV